VVENYEREAFGEADAAAVIGRRQHGRGTRERAPVRETQRLLKETERRNAGSR
jgi:hypothetical protein